MPDLQCLKVKIKDGKTHYALEWIRGMSERYPDGLNEVLAQEGMIVETIFVDHAEDGDYLIVYQRADDLLDAHRNFLDSDHPFDDAIREFVAETWGECKHLDLLIDHEKTEEGYQHTVG